MDDSAPAQAAHSVRDFLKQTMEFPWFSNHDTLPDIVPSLLLVVRPN